MTSVVSAPISRMQEKAKDCFAHARYNFNDAPVTPPFQSPRAFSCQAEVIRPPAYPVANFGSRWPKPHGASKFSTRLASARSNTSFMRRTLSA